MSIERTVHTKETEEAFYWPECEYRLKCPFCQGAGDDELGSFEECEAEVGDYCKQLNRNIEK